MPKTNAELVREIRGSWKDYRSTTDGIISQIVNMWRRPNPKEKSAERMEQTLAAAAEEATQNDRTHQELCGKVEDLTKKVDGVIEDVRSLTVKVADLTGKVADLTGKITDLSGNMACILTEMRIERASRKALEPPKPANSQEISDDEGTSCPSDLEDETVDDGLPSAPLESARAARRGIQIRTCSGL